MNLECNDAGEQLIKNHEKLRLNAYWDDYGKCWTIGWGHTGKEVYSGLSITPEQSETIFRSDIQWAEDAINHNVIVPISINQFSALCSLVFNIGAHAFATSGTLVAINSGDLDSVPQHIEGWNKSGGVVLAELIRRRQDEVDLWNTPDASA